MTAAPNLPDDVREQALNDPQWDRAGRLGDWRHYISDRVRQIWSTFSDDQKLALAEQAEQAADKAIGEDWE